MPHDPASPEALHSVSAAPGRPKRTRSAARDGQGTPASPPRCLGDLRGFTLLELLVVVAIMALASAGVSLAMRDASQTQLEREAQRLVALLESARAQSRASGVAVRWQGNASGFRFEGLRPAQGEQAWLGTDITLQGPESLLLGPEPIIEPQSVVLGSLSQPGRALRVATDGLRPFTVQAYEAGAARP